MSPIDPAIARPFTRRSLLILAGSASALVALPAVVALARDDADRDDDDDTGSHDSHDDDDTGSHDSHDDGHGGHGSGGHDDDGKVAAQGTVPAGSAEVRIVDDDADAFQPGTITVDLGQQVTFVNLDDDPHTATGAGFDTGVIEPGQQATVIFDEPGSFPFACQIHPIMTGTVAVRDASGAVPGTPAASPAASPAAGATVEVIIADFAFDPVELRIVAGTTVTWINQDSVPHTATANDGSFDTGAIDGGARGSATFGTPGTFPYACAFHPGMTGSIFVS